MPVINQLSAIDFPLSDTRLIEASAGTGKTFTIAALYVRLILGHQLGEAFKDRPLLPPDILVVTFTEAATKELRDRIRTRLSSAAQYFRGQHVKEDAFLDELLSFYPNESERLSAAQRLELAANWMDEAAVYTIHGWCNRMLKQHAFDSGSLFNLELKPDETELLNQVVRDYWRTFYYALAADNVFLPELFNEFNTPEALQKVLKDFLIKEDPIDNNLTEHKDINALCAAFYQDYQAQLSALKAPWQQWAGEMRDLIEKAVSEGCLPAKNYNAKSRVEWPQKIKDWADDPNQVELKLTETAILNLSTAGMETNTKSGVPPKHLGFDAIADLPAQISALPKLRTALIAHAVHWMRQRAVAEKNRLAQMSYNDMLTGLDFALQGKNGAQFAQVIRQHYPIALIDEFQDTDPVQYRIFEKLYPPTENAALGCFMIGDPKQAIYSFRGADIFTYLKAYTATQGKHYTLDTNYRSTEALVKAVNQLFLFADQHQEQGAFLFKSADNTNPLPFVDVSAKGREDAWLINGQPADALNCWVWESTEAIAQQDYQTALAEVTASQIVQLLNGAEQHKTGFATESEFKALKPNDIAILVRTGKEAKVMRKALAKRHLPSVYLSERDSIYASSEAVDVLIWLKALAEPRNEYKVRAALSTATLGFSYQELQHFVVDEISWEAQLERFVIYHDCWLQDGILPALRRLINDFSLHLKDLTAGEGERTLTNLLHLAELLQTASTQLEGEPALIRYLAEAIAEDSTQGSDEHILRLESDADLIKIITIHKSKGLEYPLVFLPFICGFREPDKQYDSYFKFHDTQNELRVDLNKTDASKALANKERLQEDLRLLYVALTRAQYACWLGIAPIKRGKTKSCLLEKSALGYLIGWQAEQTPNSLLAQLTKVKGECESLAITPLPEMSEDVYVPHATTEQLGTARVAEVKIADNWWIASYSALKQSHQLSQKYLPDEQETPQESTEGDEDELDDANAVKAALTIYDLPKGAGPGVLVHSLLEWCGRAGFKACLEDSVKRSDFVQKLFKHAIWQDKTPIIETALVHWLSMPLLDDAAVRLVDLSDDQYLVEMEFFMGADTVDVLALDRLVVQHFYPEQARPTLTANTIHGLMKGFIDLVFVHNQQYYVADYKFNSLGANEAAYTKAGLDAAMLEKRYDLQMLIYVLALHRLLKSRLGDAYDYDTQVGGGVYLFLRGSQSSSGGRVVNKPPKVLIEALDELFKGKVITGEPV